MANDPIIEEVVNGAVKICDPLRVFLVSHKSDSKGNLISFKICAVVSDACLLSHSDIESQILVKIDCPVPYDVLVYTVSEWNECVEDDFSFAYRIENMGDLLYAKE